MFCRYADKRGLGRHEVEGEARLVHASSCERMRAVLQNVILHVRVVIRCGVLVTCAFPRMCCPRVQSRGGTQCMLIVL